jgi:hypothetical protein
MFKLIALSITFVLIMSSGSLAQNTSILRVDDTSGPWTDTIDQDASEYAYTLETENVFRGNTALRFELRDGDCFTAYPNAPASGWDDCTRDRERTEVRERWDAPLDTPMWYQISMFIPNDYEPMYPKQMFLQWHNGLWGPNVYFHLNENKLHIDILTEPNLTTTQYTFGTDALTTGEWHQITVSAVWSNNPEQGRLIVYVDGQRIVEHYGATVDLATYQSGHGPHVKYGIYRSHLFRWESLAPHPTHVLYFDEYRRGRTFQDVDALNYAGD